jgi:hypothetical protein
LDARAPYGGEEVAEVHVEEGRLRHVGAHVREDGAAAYEAVRGVMRGHVIEDAV